MAVNTPLSYRNLLFYQLQSHDVRDWIQELDRIKDLGIDVIYLKQSVIPEKTIIRDIRERNMKIIIDIEEDDITTDADLGIDGFYCQVNESWPLEKWRDRKNKDLMWVVGTVNPDAKYYQIFDVVHDESIKDLNNYLDNLEKQEKQYPENYCRLFSLPDVNQLTNTLVALFFFLRGAIMLKHGQDAVFKKVLLTVLGNMKKDPIMASGQFHIIDIDEDDLIMMAYENDKKIRYGIFNIGDENIILNTKIPNGEYLNYIFGYRVNVNNHKLVINNHPLIFDVLK